MPATRTHQPVTATRWLRPAAVAVVVATLASCGADAAPAAGPVGDESGLGTDAVSEFDVSVATPLATGVPDAIYVTVPPVSPMIADPVPLAGPAESGDGVEVRVADHDAIDVVTRMPGEVGGPAVALTVEFANRSADPVDLGNVTVDLVLPGQVSAHQVTVEPADPVSGWLDAGQRLTGTYVFALSVEERSAVDLTVRYSANAPTLVFSGSLVDE